MLELDAVSVTVPLEESKLLFYQDCGHPQTIAVTNFCSNQMKEMRKLILQQWYVQHCMDAYEG